MIDFCKILLQVIREAADKPREITHKGAADLVTDTDQKSEKVVLGVCSSPHGKLAQLQNCSMTFESGIAKNYHVSCWLQFIQEKFPDHGVLGEEGGIMGESSPHPLWCNHHLKKGWIWFWMLVATLYT